MEKQRHREILLLGTLLIVIYTAVQHADLAWAGAIEDPAALSLWRRAGIYPQRAHAVF